MHDLKMQDKDKKGFCNLAFTQLKVYKRVAKTCQVWKYIDAHIMAHSATRNLNCQKTVKKLPSMRVILNRLSNW